MRNNKIFRFIIEHPYLIIIVFIAVFTFISAKQPYELLYPAKQITNIHLISIQDEIDLYQYSVEEIPSILDERENNRLELEATTYPSFLEDFAEIPFYKWVNDPAPVIQGKTVRITYSDHSREWICAKGTFYQNFTTSECNMTWYYFDSNAFNSLLSAYGY